MASQARYGDSLQPMQNGIAAMIATATLLDLICITPRQQSAIDSTLPSERPRTMMSHSIGRDLADGRQRARMSRVKVEARIAALIVSTGVV